MQLNWLAINSTSERAFISFFDFSNGKFEKSKKEINALSEVELIASQLSCI